MRNKVDIVDWEQIWQIHAPYFSNGVSKIPLKNGENVLLKPGPGFGDASHPTTTLLLDLLPEYVKNRVVIDVGAGSGILSIAAIKLGAKKVYSLEIDPDAIGHLKENVGLNGLESKIEVNRMPHAFDLVMINMISSEQKIAISQYPALAGHTKTHLTSGLLSSESDSYASWIGRGRPNEKRQKGEWIALVFEESQPLPKITI